MIPLSKTLARDDVSSDVDTTGEGFVKFCVKKACVGDGGELERRWMTCLGFR